MKIRLAWWDRLIRWVVSFILLAWFFAGGHWWGLWIGVWLLATASWGWDPLYAFMGIKTSD